MLDEFITLCIGSMLYFIAHCNVFWMCLTLALCFDLSGLLSVIPILWHLYSWQRWPEGFLDFVVLKWCCFLVVINVSRWKWCWWCWNSLDGSFFEYLQTNWVSHPFFSLSDIVFPFIACFWLLLFLLWMMLFGC